MTETCMLCIQRLSSHIVTESDGSICLQTSLHAACKCLIGNWVKAPQWPVTDPSHHCTVVCVCVDLFLEDDSFPYYIHYICNNRLWRWKYRPWAAILLEQNYGLDVCDSLLFFNFNMNSAVGWPFFPSNYSETFICEKFDISRKGHWQPSEQHVWGKYLKFCYCKVKVFKSADQMLISS